jgi:hypothetical protein
MIRSVFEVDASVVGHDFKEGVHGLRRFAVMLQDLLDEEGLPIDVRVGAMRGQTASGRGGAKSSVPEWAIAEARKRFYEPLPD